MEYLHNELTEKIIKVFYQVYNELGYGFLEKVYENAMMIELQSNGLYCIKQQAVKVHYKGILIGDYFADIIVNETVILELKAAEAIVQEHEFQMSII